jgi:hypothetical protein
MLNSLRTAKLVILSCVLVGLSAYPASACRYNVRETGFVDLGIEPYYLVGFVNKDTPAEITSDFEQVAATALTDTNIEFKIINIDQQEDHPAKKHLNLWKIRSFPAATLISPDGQSRAVTIQESNRPFKERLLSAFDDILQSPKRKEILQQVSQAYGVVLLIEGPDAKQNEKAKKAAESAIEQVASQMDYLPKPIEHPPVLVEMDSESLSNEAVLLWSLGLEVADVNAPLAAVLYGRARWIGPLFHGQQITEDNVASVLFIIGADCECGFDHRWLQGTMLPVKWDEKLQARAAESLGFDPENPMIKSEMAWIVRRGYSGYPSVPPIYREVAVEAEPANPTEPNEPTQAVSSTVPDANMTEPVQEVHEEAALAKNTEAAEQNIAPAANRPGATTSTGPALAEGQAPWRKSLYFISTLALSVIAVGLFIVLRTTRYRRN